MFKRKKSIRILNCDLNNEIMEEDENEINDYDESFLKCIEIPKELLAIYEG